MLTLALMLAAQRVATPLPLVRMPPVITPTAPSPSRSARYGSWTANDLGDYTEAFTSNESGSTFGILCGATCLVYVDFQKQCDKDLYYPAMVNSAKGAFAIELRCHHIDKRYILSTELTESYIDMLKAGGELGVAFPMPDSRFGVSRFSLNGGAMAVGHAYDMIEKKRNSSQQGVRDFTI